MTVRWYPALVERAEDGFGVVFPDVPGCTSAGHTVEEALRNAAEALEGHIELLAEHCEPVPEPGAPGAPVPDWLGHAAIVARALVPVEMPGPEGSSDLRPCPRHGDGGDCPNRMGE